MVITLDLDQPRVLLLSLSGRQLSSPEKRELIALEAQLLKKIKEAKRVPEWNEHNNDIYGEQMI